MSTMAELNPDFEEVSWWVNACARVAQEECYDGEEDAQ
jgi:hypothetical protein